MNYNGTIRSDARFHFIIYMYLNTVVKMTFIFCSLHVSTQALVFFMYIPIDIQIPSTDINAK